MKRSILALILGPSLCLAAASAGAEPFALRILRGSVQLGGGFTAKIDSAQPLPEGARCVFDLPEPFASYVRQVSDDCAQLVLTQAATPILDAEGYAIPSQQVPASVRILRPDGAELGRAETMFPYHNQFTDLRIVIRGVRNPVAEGQSFEVVVQGAGQAIAPALTCRWNTYGPVRFEPATGNACEGRLVVLAPTGRDADMDVEIVNLTDMHAVGYATASMIVE